MSANEVQEGQVAENGENMIAMEGQEGMQGQNGMKGMQGMNSMQGMQGQGGAMKGNGRGLSSPENEAVLDPQRFGNEKNNEFVPSQKAGEGDDNSYNKAKNMPKEAGDFVNYKELLAEYKNEAAYTSKELDIPNGMRNVVKDYFDSIQE